MNPLTRFRRWRARRAVDRIVLRLRRAGICVCDLSDEQVAQHGAGLIASRFLELRDGRLAYGDMCSLLMIGKENEDDYRIAERGLL